MLIQQAEITTYIASVLGTQRIAEFQRDT